MLQSTNMNKIQSFLVPPPVSEGMPGPYPHKGLPWVRQQICVSRADNWIYEYYLQFLAFFGPLQAPSGDGKQPQPIVDLFRFS